MFLLLLYQCLLSTILVVALKSTLLEAKKLPGLFRLSPYDGAIWLVVFLSTLCIDVPIGLTCGLAFAWFTALLRVQKAHLQLLGMLPTLTDVYVDLDRYPEVRLYSLLKSPIVRSFLFHYSLYPVFLSYVYFLHFLLNRSQLHSAHIVSSP
ncbi:unnamed protein product [Protopolystoma xenopodis]|uniref:Uncharacterized protein n=1 Tax=Protopolystoma xenopodis TaxID=117903 RepID=A0A448WUN1_9PLAT|nr:unnamed protein product [Protopolystoma xenopodis]